MTRPGWSGDAAHATAPEAATAPELDEREYLKGQDAIASLKLAVLVDRFVANLGSYDPLRAEGEAFAAALRERAQAIVEAQTA